MHSLAREFFARHDFEGALRQFNGAAERHIQAAPGLPASRVGGWRWMGLVAHPASLSLADLKSLPMRSQITEVRLRGRLVLHCAMDWHAAP